MSRFKPAPYIVAPNVDEDAQPPSCVDHLLTLRRFALIAPVEGTGGFAAVIYLSNHRATYAEALLDVPGLVEEHPNLQVTSFWLAFDPDRPEEVEAFKRLSAEEAGPQETREVH